MARNAEKARSMLNRWSELRKEEKFGRMYVTPQCPPVVSHTLARGVSRCQAMDGVL
jgi:hypothetical protein